MFPLRCRDPFHLEGFPGIKVLYEQKKKKKMHEINVLPQSIALFASPIKFSQIHSCRTRFLIAVFAMVMI